MILLLTFSYFHYTPHCPINKESGTEIGHSLEFDFVVPTSAQLSRAVKADEISVVELTQPLRLARQSIDN